ncbi:MAG TPA: peptidoglycan DD-metalloendopeptidase family protein, partial [Beutenbergiaceae bacterium]|nr:peptidoglycan DD-metalloendopeptidase family protein [Beutenbergiaceae bacterium]
VQQALANLVPRQAFSDGGILDDFTGDAKRIGTEYKGKLPDNWLRPAGKSIIDTVVENMSDVLATMFSGEGWVRPTTGRVTSRYGPRGGGHHAGMDIADGEGTPVVAPTAMKILETGRNIGPGRTGQGILGELMGGMYSYFGHNPLGGIRVRPGDLVAPGQRIGAQGSTGNVTGPHLHWEMHQGSPWNDINPHPFWDAAGGGGVMPGGPNDQWTSTIMQALRLAGLPTTGAYASAWQRQIQTESGGNPRAVQRVHDINSIMGNHARGLVQVIPPTFAAYAMPGMRDIFNPLHNLTAGMRYAKSRYGVAGMLNVIGRGRGYEHGTDHALPGWAWVGEAGPELVKFRGGEQVMNHQDSVAAVAGMEFDYERMGKAIAKHLPAMGEVNINNPNVRDTQELARTTAREFRKETKRLARI